MWVSLCGHGGVGGAVFFLQALGGIHFLVSSSFERLPAFLGSWPPFPSSKPARFVRVSGRAAISLVLSPLSPLSVYKNPSDYVVPTWIMQENLPISRSTNHQP